MIVREALRRGTERLIAAGVPAPGTDARLLLAHALDVAPEALIFDPDRRLDADDRGRFEAAMCRRAEREPVSHILRQREFWSLPFMVDRRVLDPRPDSECVVEAALAHAGDREAGLTILDLGTGSGCLLLALLSELPNARGIGIDSSAAALAVAQDNAGALGLGARTQFLCADWGRCLVGRFNLIVANPPYIRDTDLADLEPEVAQYEPRRALAAGDGLSAYRALAADLPRLLAPGGFVVLECGFGQADAVTAIVGTGGLVGWGRHRDLSGIERCLVFGHAGA